MTETNTTPPVGTRVTFREGTRQYVANVGITYVVVASPSGKPFSTDTEGRPYVWLVNADDLDKTPSRQRGRSGYCDALQITEG